MVLASARRAGRRPRAGRRGLRRGGASLEAVLQTCRQPQRLARVDGLRDVHAEPAPVDAEPQVCEPAGEPRQLATGHAAGSTADEPPLAGVAEDDEVRTPQEA